jgi:8-oxo-dGTP diphosphatase
MRKRPLTGFTYIFRVTRFTGEPTSNEEGTLRWFRVDDIPYDDMWADDIHWLLQLLGAER